MNKGKKPWDIISALNTAKGFQEAGKTLYNKAIKDNKSFGLMISSAVNYSIAIELHLKILYFFDKGYLAPNTHSLTHIYKQLSEPVISSLQSDFQKLASSFDSETLEIIGEKEDILEGYFLYAEKICVAWRYFGLDFKSPPNSGLLDANGVIDILDKHINKLINELSSKCKR